MMNTQSICARDLPEAWFMCLRACLDTGFEYSNDRGSFEGVKRKEFDYITIQVTDPYINPIVPQTPVGVPPPTTLLYVNDYLPYLLTGYKEENEEYTYGSYLEPQVDKIIQMLQNSPMTNQAYMTVGDPSTLDMKDPPCLRGIQARIRYGKLHFMVYFRSWDLWGGFGEDFLQTWLLFRL